MPKNKTGRKWSVIKDELEIHGGGCYCFFPWDRLDKHNKGIFKIGMTNNFDSRGEAYHTYFPRGVYMIAFLINPPLPISTRSSKEFKTVKSREDAHYKTIERFIFNRCVHHGGQQMYSNAHVQHANVEKKGQTEWFYCSVEQVHKAFQDAHKKFKGDLRLFHLNGIDPVTMESFNIKDVADKDQSKKPNFLGQIVYHL